MPARDLVAEMAQMEMTVTTALVALHDMQDWCPSMGGTLRIALLESEAALLRLRLEIDLWRQQHALLAQAIQGIQEER
jgi:hypothetical protein